MKKQYNNFVEVERMLQFLDIQEVATKRQKKMVHVNLSYQ